MVGVLAEPGNWAFQPCKEQRAQDEIGAIKKIKRRGVANAWRKMAVKDMLWTPARKIWINAFGQAAQGVISGQYTGLYAALELECSENKLGIIRVHGDRAVRNWRSPGVGQRGSRKAPRSPCFLHKACNLAQAWPRPMAIRGHGSLASFSRSSPSIIPSRLSIP